MEREEKILSLFKLCEIKDEIQTFSEIDISWLIRITFDNELGNGVSLPEANSPGDFSVLVELQAAHNST